MGRNFVIDGLLDAYRDAEDDLSAATVLDVASRLNVRREVEDILTEEGWEVA